MAVERKRPLITSGRKHKFDCIYITVDNRLINFNRSFKEKLIFV